MPKGFSGAFPGVLRKHSLKNQKHFECDNYKSK